MCGCQNGKRRVVKYNRVTVNAANTNLLGKDHNRVGVIITSSGQNVVTLTFGEPLTQTDTGFVARTNLYVTKLTKAEIGDIIEQPLYGWGQAGGEILAITELLDI